jgi:hypothetical protein
MPKGQFTLGNRAVAAQAIRQEIHQLIKALKALGAPLGINLGPGKGATQKKGAKPQKGPKA